MRIIYPTVTLGLFQHIEQIVTVIAQVLRQCMIIGALYRDKNLRCRRSIILRLDFGLAELRIDVNYNNITVMTSKALEIIGHHTHHIKHRLIVVQLTNRLLQNCLQSIAQLTQPRLLVTHHNHLIRASRRVIRRRCRIEGFTSRK